MNILRTELANKSSDPKKIVELTAGVVRTISSKWSHHQSTMYSSARYFSSVFSFLFLFLSQLMYSVLNFLHVVARIICAWSTWHQCLWKKQPITTGRTIINNVANREGLPRTWYFRYISNRRCSNCERAPKFRKHSYMYIIQIKSAYAKCALRLLLACCSSSAECFFSRFRPRGKLACHGYIMNHVLISAELRGGARRIIKRRLAGFIWQEIAFRLPETSRSLRAPHIVFQNLIFW